MVKLRKLTDPKVQLAGSCVVVLGVLIVGFASVAVLDGYLKAAQDDAQRARSLAWVRDVVGVENMPNARSDMIEISAQMAVPGPHQENAVLILRHGKKPLMAIRLTETSGYNGNIDLALAVDDTGAIIGVRVLTHRETIGFGDVIGRPNSDWMRSFAGRSLQDPVPQDWRLRADGGAIDGISGATITANGVIAGVAHGLKFMATLKDAQRQ